MKQSLLVTNVLSCLNSLSSFLNIPKVGLVNEELYKELYNTNQLKHLCQQIDIRWGCKFKAVDFSVEKLKCILATLVRVVNDPDDHNSKHVERAGGFYHKLINGRTIVALVTLKFYLAELYYLNKELQKENINWLDVGHELKRTSLLIANISDDEILQNCRECAADLGIPLTMTLLNNIHFTHSALDEANGLSADSTITRTVKSLNNYLKDMLAKEFRVRFDAKNVELLKGIDGLNAGSDPYLSFEKLKLIIDQFESCITINKTMLKVEIERARADFELALPINPTLAENLTKLYTIKDTINVNSDSRKSIFMHE